MSNSFSLNHISHDPDGLVSVEMDHTLSSGHFSRRISPRFCCGDELAVWGGVDVQSYGVVDDGEEFDVKDVNSSKRSSGEEAKKKENKCVY